MNLPQLVEPVRRCRYCKREMSISASEYTTNPFCRVCLPERMLLHADPLVEWRPAGHYLEPIPRRPVS